VKIKIKGAASGKAKKTGETINKKKSFSRRVKRN